MAKKKIDLEEYYELLKEARAQVDKKYSRGKVQTDMIYNMLVNDPQRFSNYWYRSHALLFWCQRELDDE